MNITNSTNNICCKKSAVKINRTFHSKHYSPRFNIPCFFKFTKIIEIAAGVIPEIRLAWPIETGRCCSNFARTSLDKPDTLL